MSFEAVSKNRQRWRWGDVGRQTVQRRHRATGNARSPTVDSRVRRITSCEDDDDRRRRQLKTATLWMQSERYRGARPCRHRWAQLTWNRCIPETAASVGLAALVWRAHTEKFDVSVWRRHWEPTEVDWAETQEVLRVLRCSSRDVA